MGTLVVSMKARGYAPAYELFHMIAVFLAVLRLRLCCLWCGGKGQDFRCKYHYFNGERNRYVIDSTGETMSQRLNHVSSMDSGSG